MNKVLKEIKRLMGEIDRTHIDTNNLLILTEIDEVIDDNIEES